MRFAVIENGVVANVIEADPAWVAASHMHAAPSEVANIGDLFDGEAFSPPPRVAAFSPAAVKTACSRRILAVLSDTAQRNLAAAAAAGWPSEADEAARAAAQAAFAGGVAWIAAMQAAARSLIAAGDATFENDAHWPSPPPEAVALAARY
jgi:hypothetical protein